MKTFLAAAVQLNATSDKGSNVAGAVELVERAANAGAELVVLPELFWWSGPQREESAAAESVPGPSSELLASAAARTGVYLVAGSILEREAGGDRCFNTCLLFAPDGTLLASYRKIHLFDVEIEGQVSARESRTRSAGDDVVCVDTELGKLGLAVCYDLRFPELFRRLARAGAEIVALPSAFTAPTGAAHWHVLIRARAIENQCYVVAPNQFGPTSHGFDSYGHSLIVDPWGTVLADAGGDGPGLVTAGVEAEKLQAVRRNLPALTHVRLDS